jgi:CheY-like chemotaxis protein
MLSPWNPPLHAGQKRRLASSLLRPAAGSAIRILIVDQDRQVGVTLSFMLAARRFDEVRAVRSGRRAIVVAEQFLPDIVFLDLELPDGGGIAVGRQLARDSRNRRQRLIALTRHPEDPIYDTARAAGFERLLLKPVSPEELDKVLGIGRTAD